MERTFGPIANPLDTLLNNNKTFGVALVICLILAIIGGLALFVTYLNIKNERRFSGILGWLYDFLNFKKMVAEALLKVIYLMSAIFVFLSAFATLIFSGSGGIGERCITFVVYFVVGNVFLRLLYELMIAILIICRNTTESSKKQHEEKIMIGAKEEQNKKVALQNNTGIVFCRNCGNSFGATQKFCPNCGKARE